MHYVTAICIIKLWLRHQANCIPVRHEGLYIRSSPDLLQKACRGREGEGERERGKGRERERVDTSIQDIPSGLTPQAVSHSRSVANPTSAQSHVTLGLHSSALAKNRILGTLHCRPGT